MPESEGSTRSNWAYLIIIAGFMCQMALNFGSNTTGQTMSTLAADLGVTIADAKTITAYYGMTYALAGVFWGFFVDAVGIRKQLLICPMIMALGAFCVGMFGSSIANITVLWTIVAVGAAGLSFAFLPKVATTWFHPSRRARGMLVIPLGGSFISTIMGIAWPFVINTWGSWRLVYLIMAGIEVVLAIVMFLLARDEPADVGQVPWGSPVGTPVTRMYQLTPEGRAEKRRDLKNAYLNVLKYPRTYLVAIPMIFYSINMSATSSYLSPSLQAAGFSLAVAGLASSITFGVKLAGQAVMPFFADRFPRKVVLMITWVLQGVFLCALATTVVNAVSTGQTPSLVMTFAFIVCFTFCDGCNAILQTCNGESFPEKLRGTGPGVVSGFTAVGRFVGPMVAGSLVAIAPGMNFYWSGACIALAGITGFLFYPKSGGKFGDPLAKVAKENAA